MNAAAELLSGPLVEAVGWALVHFLWQGAAVAAVLALALWAARNRSPNLRYLLSCGALLVMAACPVVTFLWLRQPASRVQPRAVEPAPSIRAAEPARPAPAALPGPPVQVETAGPVRGFEPAGPARWRRAREAVDKHVGAVVAAWLIGVAFLSLRLLFGLAKLHRVKRSGRPETAGTCADMVAHLAGRMRVSRPVRVLESAVARAPIVVGWLRPVVLLPASALTGLTPRQLEAVLAHELAHVRRHDYLVNIAQTVVETLLFYHPAVHWVSARIRSEREVCCDELAVEAYGDARTYARALTELAELRCARRPMAVELKGGSLLDRIRRILGLQPERRTATSRWLAGLLTVFVAASVAAGAYVAAKPMDEGADREEMVERITATLCHSPIHSTAHRLRQMDEEELDALLRFYEAYSLGAQENVRLISAPFMPERLTYHRWAEPGPRVPPYRAPNGIIWHQQDEKLLLWGQHHGKQPKLASLLRSVTGLPRQHIEGDPGLLGRPLRADVVYRPEAPMDQLVEELERVLRESSGWSVRLDLRQVGRPVLIASGEYGYQPVARWAAYLRGRSPAIDSVEIFGSRPRADIHRGGGGGGDLKEFLVSVGDYLVRPIVGEDITGAPDRIQWSYGPRLQEANKGRLDPLPPAETALVLRHLTEQTGLTFREGTKTVPILFVASMEQTEEEEARSGGSGGHPAIEQGAEAAGRPEQTEVRPASGPAIERVILGRHQWLDLDRGTVHNGGDVIRSEQEELDWVAKTGADVTLVVGRGGFIEPMVGFFGVTLLSCDDSAWDRLHGQSDLVQQLAEGPVDARASVEAFQTRMLPGSTTFPVTYAFLTREGTIGILQIVGFSEDPDGVKVRYKMLRGAPHEFGDSCIWSPPLPDVERDPQARARVFFGATRPNDRGTAHTWTLLKPDSCCISEVFYSIVDGAVREHGGGMHKGDPFAPPMELEFIHATARDNRGLLQYRRAWREAPGGTSRSRVRVNSTGWPSGTVLQQHVCRPALELVNHRYAKLWQGDFVRDGQVIKTFIYAVRVVGPGDRADDRRPPPVGWGDW